MTMVNVLAAPAASGLRRRWRERLALAAIIACGLAIRVFHIGGASLWNDELFSRFYVETGLPFMWSDGFRIETTPPLYYSILLGWTHLFGTGEAALRWPSAIASALTIPLVGWLGRELGGRTVGLLAAAIFALAPMEVFYAQEARAYAFMMPPVAVMLLTLAWVLRDATKWRPMIGYTMAAAVAIYVHSTSVFLIAACGLVITVGLLTAPRRRGLPRWIATNAVLGLLCLPEALAMLAQVHSNRLSWMLPTTLWDIRMALASLIAGPAASPLLLTTAMALLLAAALLAALVAVRPGRRVVVVLIAIPAVDFALILLAGLRQPLLVPRLLCWMWIPLAVLLAGAICARGRASRVLAATTAIVLAVGLGFQLSQNATAKEPWGVLLARLAPLLARADLVVTGPWTQPMALAYYGTDADKVRHWNENMPATIENTNIRDLLGVQEISRDRLADAIRDGQRVLLIQRSVEFRYRTLLAGLPAPREVVTQSCWSDGECLGALYWAPR